VSELDPNLDSSFLKGAGALSGVISFSRTVSEWLSVLLFFSAGLASASPGFGGDILIPWLDSLVSFDEASPFSSTVSSGFLSLFSSAFFLLSGFTNLGNQACSVYFFSFSKRNWCGQ